MTRAGRRRVRYAVVGLGYIAQSQILPAFAHARDHAELVALLSDDPVKRRELAQRYGARAYAYQDYEACLRSGDVDAVFIALPNHLHKEYTVRAASAGIHVLCEKPMAVTEAECRQMIDAARLHRVKLMVAYRLHFEAANLAAVQIARSGRLGAARLFNSVFTMSVREGNVRLDRESGGGTLYDIGIYCINAARYLFQDEPNEVMAYTASRPDPRFREVEEMTSAILRFPGQRLASFSCSFGAYDVSTYQIVGTRGTLRVEPAYEHSQALAHRLTVGGRSREKSFPKRDQFAPELIYFSRCVLNDRDPEPSGPEGLADVRIIEACYRSAKAGHPVRVPPILKPRHPTLAQEIHRPPLRKAPLIHVQPPSET